MAWLAGCATPATRAKARPAAFQRLSAADQRLVLHGRVRKGLDREAVIIAWGEPDRKSRSAARPQGDAKDGAAAETWTYRRRLTLRAPIGSYDQLPLGNALITIGASRVTNPGFGFGGVGYGGWLLNRPNVERVDNSVRRAAFLGNRLFEFETWHEEVSQSP